MTAHTISEVSTSILHILAKSIKTELVKRDRLAVGKYNVMEVCNLQVEGTVNVFADEQYTPTTSIPMKTAFALFIKYSGVTGPAAMNALVKAMTEAAEIERSDSADKKTTLDALNELADLTAASEKVQKGLSKLPKETRKGKVTVKGTVL